MKKLSRQTKQELVTSKNAAQIRAGELRYQLKVAEALVRNIQNQMDLNEEVTK